MPEFSRRGARVGGRGASDASRTFLEKAVVVPDEHQRRSDGDLPRARRSRGAAPAAGGGRGGRGGGGRGPSATVLVHHSMIKLPETPMMPRLFDERVGYFTQGLTDYGTGETAADAEALHHALPPREERSERGDVRSREADHLLGRSGDAEEVGAVREEGHRRLAAGVRNGGLPERHRRQGSAESGDPELERRGRALLGGSVAAVDDGKRGRSAHARSAQRRDSRSGRAVLPQRPEPREKLVLRPGRPERSARAAAAAARRSHGRARSATSSRTRSATRSASSTT